jgi:hypothetical protein
LLVLLIRTAGILLIMRNKIAVQMPETYEAILSF